jgi:trehalose 6-phosphate phosphatase
LYTVVGTELGAEAEIGGLSGYAGSRPVRVGNGAANQVQLDVFGPIVQLVYVLFEAGAPLSQEHSGLVEKMVRAVAARWHEQDHGIWEIRHRPRHHVHSKVMCWMTVDRAIKIWERFRRQPPESWIQLREAIKSEVLVRGWNDKIGAFGAAYGSDELDAASLWVGLSGLIGPDHPRFISTVDAIEAGLLEGQTVYRYLYEDGLPGREGGFHICTSWLIDSLVRIGDVDRGGRLFKKLLSLVGQTGCLSEEYDPTAGRGLGNHPQAYSHLGLILNALHLESKGWSDSRF